MENFEEGLQVELDKLPYEQHVDDGRYNDGKQAGFELGARWALEYIESLLPTEEDIAKETLTNMWQKHIHGFIGGVVWTKIIIKSRLAGKEEK